MPHMTMAIVRLTWPKFHPLFFFVIYHRMCNKSNKTCTTSWIWSDYLHEYISSPPDFCVLSFWLSTSYGFCDSPLIPSNLSLCIILQRIPVMTYSNTGTGVNSGEKKRLLHYLFTPVIDVFVNKISAYMFIRTNKE